MSYYIDETSRKTNEVTEIRLGRFVFRTGDTVQLKRHSSAGKSRIENFYSDVLGGVRLEEPLDGFRSWNVTDLQKVSNANKSKSVE